MSALKEIKRHRSFDGWQCFYEHPSSTTQTPMRVGVYLPPVAEHRPCPVVYFLAGLTCTEETFAIKAGAQRVAAQHGLIIVTPDTSPRGAGIPGEDNSWDFGSGAGFYVNATTAAYARHYRMYDYIVDELPALIHAQFPTRPAAQSILGHSMGGHGALVIGLRQSERYRSVSAIAPICAPSSVAWGHKAFTGYLGPDQGNWTAYDACELIKSGVGRDRRLNLLVDQGSQDEFLASQLMPERLKDVCADAGQPLTLRFHPGYDHGYYFIASVIADHLAHHARALQT